ncbi:histidine phosphatase family protein [Roseateles sp. BYS180W]|uniref:Histidine phosphatase family protein n=1 Tax=Roseateles rivi TaxID=3299028 RepID=A0ABW7FX52_9BURK
MPQLYAWRHPRPEGIQGLVVGGRFDPPVHWRRAKRLARRIQALARRQRLPHTIHTSPLQRCASVGRWLHRWGWRHVRLESLREADFGHWEGRAWADIPRADIDAWVADFAHHRPGGGESVADMLARVHQARSTLPAQALLVTHGGWISAAQWLAAHGSALPSAALWPSGVPYASRAPLR